MLDRSATLVFIVSFFAKMLLAVAVTAGMATAFLIPSGDGYSGAATAATAARSCTTPRAVVSLYFSRSKYPHIRAHALAAIRKGWPAVLVLNRNGATQRRNRLLRGIRTRRGYDRDEYPPAVGRGRGYHLESGSGPTGWRADVAYVASRENRSHGSSMGGKLRKYCDGTRFRYAFN